MKRETVAEIRFSGPVGKRPRGRFLAQAKLPSDAAENPYGQWDLVVDPVVEIDLEQPDQIMAFVGFLSPEAPNDALRRGVSIELFHGTNPVGTALVLASGSDQVGDGARRDSDFLAGPEAA
jgi:hypothetical protein